MHSYIWFLLFRTVFNRKKLIAFCFCILFLGSRAVVHHQGGPGSIPGCFRKGIGHKNFVPSQSCGSHRCGSSWKESHYTPTSSCSGSQGSAGAYLNSPDERQRLILPRNLHSRSCLFQSSTPGKYAPGHLQLMWVHASRSASVTSYRWCTELSEITGVQLGLSHLPFRCCGPPDSLSCLKVSIILEGKI